MANAQPRAGGRGETRRAPARAAWPASPARARLAARLALAAAALTVVFAGIRAAIPPATWGAGPWYGHGIALGTGLELVFVVLLAAVERRRRRAPGAGQPAAGLRTLLRAVLVAGVIAIPILMIVASVGKLRPARPHPFSPPRLRSPSSGRLHSLAAHGGGSGAAPVLYALLALALLGAIAVAVILLRRRRGRGVAWDDIGDVPDDEPPEQLRRAVQSGQAALREIDDARLAIIACYLAMERSLATAGAVRDAAETPDELLARAAAAGLTHGAEAAALTALFYEARFSSHPLPPSKRQEAQRALEVLAASLDAAPADAAPGAGAGPGRGAGGAAR